MLKAGVLTFHRCINYGSYWQARCLVEGLRSRGMKAVILDHDSKRVNLAEWRCAFRPTLPTFVPRSDFPFYRAKIEKFFREFEKLPLSARFDLERASGIEEYDLVIVGSDEVWNLLHPWYGGCALFFGDGLPARRLISYAASFGNYQSSWGLIPDWTDRLRAFSSISVRDLNSRQIIENALGLVPEIVLDPCLQFSLDPDPREDGFYRRPYAAVYGHNFSTGFAGEVRRWAARRGLLLVSIGYRNDWADEQWLSADPHDFVHFIRGAQAVATNFFHGCVFALRSGKPFVCEKTEYRSNKIQDLLALVGGEKHLFGEDSSPKHIENCLDDRPEDAVARRIDNLRRRSEDYLDKAVGIAQAQYA